LSQQLRSYGITTLLSDIKKSDQWTAIFGNTNSGSLYSVQTQTFPLCLLIGEKEYTVNFVNYSKDGDLGFHKPSTQEIFIDLASCQDAFAYETHAAKSYYHRTGTLDIYDYIT
jgi:hypothetical protein